MRRYGEEAALEMATFEGSHSFLVRGVRVLLRLEAGLDRGRVSAPEEGPDGFSAHRAYVGAPEEWDLESPPGR